MKTPLTLVLTALIQRALAQVPSNITAGLYPSNASASTNTSEPVTPCTVTKQHKVSATAIAGICLIVVGFCSLLMFGVVHRVKYYKADRKEAKKEADEQAKRIEDEKKLYGHGHGHRHDKRVHPASTQASKETPKDPKKAVWSIQPSITQPPSPPTHLAITECAAFSTPSSSVSDPTHSR